MVTNEVKELINSAVLKMINYTGSPDKLETLKAKHDKKLHFIPKRYRVFGGLLQSMNIQFGNFIEELMTALISNEERYEILTEYSGKMSNSFQLSKANDARIDAYISSCQYSNIDVDKEFPKLLQEIIDDSDKNTKTFKHDIDLLFKDTESGKIYYLEIKYNDDHDTGKFVDINRKFIKTYAYLVRELNIDNTDDLVPILFFFTNKKMKGNIYVPEKTNIRRGKGFFNEFLHIDYEDIDEYLSSLSESDDVVKMFDDLYYRVMGI